MDKLRIRSAVIESIKKIKKFDTVTIADDETFENYGLDSLDRMNLVLELESALGVELDGVDMDKIKSINKLADYLK